MAGMAVEEALVGAGAGASAASATVAEAATRTAQAIFFISITTCRNGSSETRKIEEIKEGLISKLDQR